MKHIIATVIGFLSAFLFYMMIMMTTSAHGFSMLMFFVGWVAAQYLCLVNTARNIEVIKRGFLIGTLEWVMMALAGIFISARAVVETTSSASSNAETAGAMIGGGLSATISGGLCLGMAFICLLGFFIYPFFESRSQ